MAVGASFAELAVILVDASQGVLTQTIRHTRICSLMGIRHFVFAVNKMDLVGFDERRFNNIKKTVDMLMSEFEFDSLDVIPVSATDGDNITKNSERTQWYAGKSLLTYLEEIEITYNDEEKGFTLPIQRVCRPDRTFRGFQGQIESGKIAVGDEITTLPSKETACVTSIIDAGKEVNSSDKGHAVTLCLDREVDVSRGCVIVRNAKPHVSNLFTAKLLWMDDDKLVEGKNYLLKIGTKSIPAVILKIRHKVGVNDGSELRAKQIFKNEIAVCDISTSEKIVFDKFKQNQGLGSFILVDRLSHMTSACGVVEHSLRRSNNLTWQNMDISREQRAAQKNQTPKTIWFTGLSGSGKSTLANEIEKRFLAKGCHTMELDGDNVRMGLNSNLGFTEADRIENIRRIAEVCKLMNDAGLIVITSFISPYRQDRVRAKEIIGYESFIEVYVSTPLDECERRDIKGLYRKARSGEIPNFTGVSAPYEPPEKADIIVDTSRMTIEKAADYVFEKMEEIL